jgi:hypothetical protein
LIKGAGVEICTKFCCRKAVIGLEKVCILDPRQGEAQVVGKAQTTREKKFYPGGKEEEPRAQF